MVSLLAGCLERAPLLTISSFSSKCIIAWFYALCPRKWRINDSSKFWLSLFFHICLSRCFVCALRLKKLVFPPRRKIAKAPDYCNRNAANDGSAKCVFTTKTKIFFHHIQLNKKASENAIIAVQIRSLQNPIKLVTQRKFFNWGVHNGFKRETLFKRNRHICVIFMARW